MAISDRRSLLGERGTYGFLGPFGIFAFISIWDIVTELEVATDEGEGGDERT